MKVPRIDEHYIEIKRRFLAEGQRFVLVEVRAGEGFDPGIGADLQYYNGKLIVDASGNLYGTSLTHELDEKILKEALGCISAKMSKAITIDSVQVTFEYVAPPPKLIIIGATSVGLAIARIASGLDFKVILVDENDGEHREDNVACVAKLKTLQFDEATYIVVAHPLGYLRAIRYSLDMPWAYFGVVGSRAKIEELWKNLSALGVADTLRFKVHAPLGFDIGAQTSEEIAIATLAEIIAVKNGVPCGRVAQGGKV